MKVNHDTPEFLALIQSLSDAHATYMRSNGFKSWAENGPHPVDHYIFECGPRYIRVMRAEEFSTGCQHRNRDGSVCGLPLPIHQALPPVGHSYQYGSCSAVCFVDREDGNIYYPKGWKGPQKNFPRGNVFSGYEKWSSPSGAISTAR